MFTRDGLFTAEIHWPSGIREIIKLPAVDRIYTIREGSGIVDALRGGEPCTVTHPGMRK
jgi:hypothetical protein